MNLITNIQDKYANLEAVKLNTNLKQNTLDYIKEYSLSGFNIIPLRQHSKKPILQGWAEKTSISFDEVQNCFEGSYNYGLRLDYRYQDGNYLASIDIEDVSPELMLKLLIAAKTDQKLRPKLTTGS